MGVWPRVAVAVTHRGTTRSRSLDPALSIPLCCVDHMAEVEQVVSQRAQQRHAAHLTYTANHQLVHPTVGLEVRVDGLHRRAAQRLELLRFRR